MYDTEAPFLRVHHQHKIKFRLSGLQTSTGTDNVAPL